MKQESGTDEEICEFAKEKYGAKFTLFSKTNVNGDQAHDVFKFCRINSPLFDPKKQLTKQIPWNFSKFVIDREGKVRGYFDIRSKVHDCEKLVKELLA